MVIGRKSGVARPRFDRQALTLIEAAIALAVAGLVVGGIWIGAAVVRESIAINKASDQVYQIARNVRALYAAHNPPTISEDGTLNAVLLQANIFPAEMVQGGAVFHDWDQATVGGSALVSPYNLGAGGATAGPETSFQISFLNVPPQICVGLVTKNFSADTRTGLQAIDIGGNVSQANLGEIPLSVARAAADCGNAAVTIGWVWAVR